MVKSKPQIFTSTFLLENYILSPFDNKIDFFKESETTNSVVLIKMDFFNLKIHFSMVFTKLVMAHVLVEFTSVILDKFRKEKIEI